MKKYILAYLFFAACLMNKGHAIKMGEFDLEFNKGELKSISKPLKNLPDSLARYPISNYCYDLTKDDKVKFKISYNNGLKEKNFEGEINLKNKTRYLTVEKNINIKNVVFPKDSEKIPVFPKDKTRVQLATLVEKIELENNIKINKIISPFPDEHIFNESLDRVCCISYLTDLEKPEKRATYFYYGSKKEKEADQFFIEGVYVGD